MNLKPCKALSDHYKTISFNKSNVSTYIHSRCIMEFDLHHIFRANDFEFPDKERKDILSMVTVLLK